MCWQASALCTPASSTFLSQQISTSTSHQSLASRTSSIWGIGLERSISSSGRSLALLNVSNTWRSWLFMAYRGRNMSMRSSSSSERERRCWRRRWVWYALKRQLLWNGPVKSSSISTSNFQLQPSTLLYSLEFLQGSWVSCTDPFDLDSVVWGSSCLRAPKQLVMNVYSYL